MRTNTYSLTQTISWFASKLAILFRATCIVVCLVASSFSRAPGSLDPTFGNGGKVTTAVGYDGAHSVAIQPDGRIVIASLICLQHPIEAIEMFL